MVRSSQILTPLQIARATIEAYPYMKDVFGIMEVVAAEVRIVFNITAADAPWKASLKCAVCLLSYCTLQTVAARLNLLSENTCRSCPAVVACLQGARSPE